MSSFQRGDRSQRLIPGTKPSLQNGQLRVSTGNASIDAIFGGGLPIGSVWLIEEDRYGCYTRALQRYFLGEGAVHGHEMFVVNLNENPSQILSKIPLPCQERASSKSKSFLQHLNAEPSATGPQPAGDGRSSDDLRVAWRYNNLTKVDAELKTSNSNATTSNFDLSTCIDAVALSELRVTTFGLPTLSDEESTATSAAAGAARPAGFHNPLYANLLQQIGQQLRACEADNLLRLCICGVGGPLWYQRNISADMCRFLRLLRAMLRQSNAVCCISMPMHLLQYCDERLSYRIRNCVDYALQLESFAGSDRETNPIFADYHGLLHVRRLVALNTLAAGCSPSTHDLAFKLRRRQFVVEKLHLPPELQEAADSAAVAASAACGGGSGKSLLDF